MNNTPFIITIQQWDIISSISKDKSDLTIDEVIDMFEGILYSIGFSKEVVEQAFIEKSLSFND